MVWLSRFSRRVSGGSKDKIAQVFLTSILLIKPVVALCSSMRSSEFLPLLEPLGVALVDKLGDNNARCRDATFQALVNLAHEKLVGAPFVTSLVLRKLKKRQAAAWRPLLTRLQLLHNIIDLLGLGRASGLTADNLIRFLVDTNACAHSNGDVREAAKEICVAIHKTEGDSIIGRLGHLRKKQLEEYKVCVCASVCCACVLGVAAVLIMHAPRVLSNHCRRRSMEALLPARHLAPVQALAVVAVVVVVAAGAVAVAVAVVAVAVAVVVVVVVVVVVRSVRTSERRLRRHRHRHNKRAARVARMMRRKRNASSVGGRSHRTLPSLTLTCTTGKIAPC